MASEKPVDGGCSGCCSGCGGDQLISHRLTDRCSGTVLGSSPSRDLTTTADLTILVVDIAAAFISSFFFSSLIRESRTSGGGGAGQSPPFVVSGVGGAGQSDVEDCSLLTIVTFSLDR